MNGEQLFELVGPLGTAQYFRDPTGYHVLYFEDAISDRPAAQCYKTYPKAFPQDQAFQEAKNLVGLNEWNRSLESFDGDYTDEEGYVAPQNGEDCF